MAVDADGASPVDEDVFVYTTDSIVPRDVGRVHVHPSVTVIPREAFMNCSKLEEVELSEGLQEIGEWAFYFCESLKRIKIPSTVTIIGNLSFNHCGKLEEVELSEGLLEIRAYAFHYCTALKKVKIPSTLTIISTMAFYSCYQLKEVELSEGLQTIGQSAFVLCTSLKHINLPTTIRRIDLHAFAETKSLLTINLPDGIERIGSYAFYQGGLLTFRIPPLITTMPMGMVDQAKSLFSVELSQSVTHVNGYAFWECYSLRNVAFSPNASIFQNDDDLFFECEDLLLLFGSDERVINALKHRFDNLPIHKMLYYQSYEPVTVEQLNDATNIRSGQRRTLRSKLDPTGQQQDCLGMTPLHILACSTVQDICLYQVLIEKYPENLITEDRWGTLPLLYAVWGNAPSEIVKYLVERYKAIYPEFEFDWTRMVETLGLANVRKGFIEKLVDLQKDFPKQKIDWERLIESVIDTRRYIRSETFGYLVQFSLAKRINAIGLKQWRDAIEHTTENCAVEGVRQRQDFITEVKTKLVHYETEYQNLKEATSLLELALWKHKMNDHILGEKKRRRKKTKIEDSSIREQCRISCGADIVIQHMLSYLVCPPIAPSSQDDSNSDHHSSSESDDEIHDESDDDSHGYL